MSAPAQFVALALGSDAILGLAAGVGLSALAALAFWLGARAGRRSSSPSQRALVDALRALTAGRLDHPPPDVAPDDPLSSLASAVADLTAALRERQRRLERRATVLGDALESAPGRALLLLGPDLGVRTAGEGIARWIGGRPSDFEGQPAASLFTAESWQALLPALTDVAERRAGLSGRLELLRAGQPPKPVEVYACEGGGPGGAILLQLAPDAREGDDEVSRARQLETLRGVLEGIEDGVLVLSKGQIVDTNPAMERWLGEGLVGREFKDLLPAEDLLRAVDRVSRAEAGESVEPFVCLLVPDDSRLRPRRVEILAREFERAEGPAVILTIRDRSRQALAAEQSRETQLRLRAVLENVADGFVLLSPPPIGESSWRVALSNSRTRELLALPEDVPLGITEEEFRARLARRFADPEVLGAFLDDAALSPDAEPVGTFDLAGAPARSIELIVRPVRALGGATLGRVLVIRDITHHREAERRLASDAAEIDRARDALQRSYEALASVNRDLEQKSEKLDRVNRELRDLDEARKNLLASVTHELQTPLVSIRGYTQMVLEGRLGKINEEQRKGLEVSVRNVDRMVELIANLLAMARSEESGPVELASVDPGPILAGVLERHAELARRLRVDLEQSQEQDHLRILAERDAFVQVLDNLVSNAIKFNRAGGRVQVSLREGPAGFVILDVADTGVGIPDEERERIFERFYRGKTAREVSGTGIGLATVRKLVERHKGKIEISSVVDEGTTIRVFWPRASSASASAEQQAG